MWYRVCLSRAFGKRNTRDALRVIQGEVMESNKNFKRRVLQATGLELSQIPVGEENDVLGGTIFCKRGGTYVVSHGYPDRQDDDGCDIWDARPENFRVVNLDKATPKEVVIPEWIKNYLGEEITDTSDASEERAFEILEEAIKGEEFVDNYRYAQIGDEKGMAEYKEAIENGCCGSTDLVIVFADGKKAIVGCNFGH